MIRSFALGVLLVGAVSGMAAEPTRSTAVSIVADKFLVNGQPTYKGRTWNGTSIEGLLMNSRMVQATFDDRKPETRGRWVYPDTKTWDANRNTCEFLEQMPILFNEDDHFDFDHPTNNFHAAVGEFSSWGYFDYRMKGEGFKSVPVNWSISSDRKRGFFKLLREITGEQP